MERDKIIFVNFMEFIHKELGYVALANVFFDTPFLVETFF